MRGKAKVQAFLDLVSDQLRSRDRWIPDALKEFPPPWRNITHEWNAAQAHYYLRTGQHWHGALRKGEGRSRKHCAVLIVQDRHHGEPIKINPETWGGYPDYFDFKKIVALPYDDLFHKRQEILIDHAITSGLYGVADMIVEAVNAHYGGQAKLEA